MKPTVLKCHKFIYPKQLHKVYLLFCAASLSVCWILAESKASSAQTNPINQQAGNYQLGLRELLPVPQSPTSSGQNTASGVTVPPPPGTQQLENPSTTRQSQTPTDDIKQLENAFIQQMNGTAPKTTPSTAMFRRKTQNRTKLPLVAAGNDNSDVGLRLLGVTNDSNQTNSGVAPTFNELLNSQTPPPPPDTTETQEFSSPNSQTPVFPLPPLPGTTPLNSPGVMQPSVSDSPAPTFNELLNSPDGIEPATPGITPSQEFTTTPVAPITSATYQRPLGTSNTLKQPSLTFQGVYVTQGDDTSARARLSGIYPLSPQALVGATLDLTSEGSSFDDSRNEGLNINELYLATSLGGVPNLRFAVGQLDLTSYFDRNSFAKDGASQFFNPVFQTNPALAVTGISSRPGLLLNWSATDNIEAKAAVFSSSDSISDFALDGFAGEIGIRYGNAIIRGTYASDRDAGIRDSFEESFAIARNSAGTTFGTQEDDREEAYGVNAEVFIPNLKLGLFGRYGRYENRNLGEGADTYVLGATLLDLFTSDDRLGLAYGRALSNDSLRRGDNPDVLELYYDFRFLPFLRVGFSVQGRDSFEETVFGIRVKTDFDVTPRGRNAQ